MTETSEAIPSWLPANWTTTVVPVGAGFSLAETCGPVAWAAGRWPDLDWRDGCLVRVGHDELGETVAIVAWPSSTPDRLTVASPSQHAAGLIGPILNLNLRPPEWDDPVIAGLARRFRGLRPFAHGSIFLGLLTSIVGQSISIASAATTQRRLAALFAEPIDLDGRAYWPLPTAGQLAMATVEEVRSSGVTWRRAEALVAIARLAAAGQLPDRRPDWPTMPTSDRLALLRELPLVGPWTARSTLLWGVADESVWPAGDVALLRAARRAYNDETLDMKRLVRLADGWGTAPGWATRLLWAGLFGAAPATMSPSWNGSVAALP